MKIWGIGQISPDEKENILSQHKEIYNGYKSYYPNIPSEQPLYVQDFANDKGGITVNNRGEVKKYTNVGINEQTESKEVCDECGAMEMEESKGMCSECGGEMMEGECMECGWKGEVGEGKQMCSECGNQMMEGECMECGWRGDMEEGYKTGHLDDIYDEEDLNPNDEFDYVKGASNRTNAFHIKEDDGDDFINYEDNFEDPDNEDDGFEDLQMGDSEMYEQGYTGGGNAPDMDLSNIEPAYDFVSDGPMAGGDVYPTEGEMDEEWEQMESAWAEDIDENDVSGVQGIYGDMEPAYDFDSEGPGKAGPYQHSEWGEDEMEEQYPRKHEYRKMLRKADAEDKGEDFDDSELDMSDYEDYGDMKDKSWEEISSYTGDDEFSNVDEDIRESVVIQKNKIMEMMNRMKVIK